MQRIRYDDLQTTEQKIERFRQMTKELAEKLSKLKQFMEKSEERNKKK
jgi:hypothetical protein